MLGAMAIRMKEWGMLRAPSSSVHLPVQGVMGWGEAAQSLGSGIAKALLGSAELVQEKEQVTATGDLADFSRRFSFEQSFKRSALCHNLLELCHSGIVYLIEVYVVGSEIF